MLRRVMQLRCRWASDTFMYPCVFGYLHDISKCQWTIPAGVYIVFSDIFMVSRSVNYYYYYLRYLWVSYGHVLTSTMRFRISSWYLEVSMSDTWGCLCDLSMSDTCEYLLVFELPKSGNFTVPISGAFEHPLPVILYIGIYSQRKMD